MIPKMIIVNLKDDSDDNDCSNVKDCDENDDDFH
jgi:hypothetical protein